MQSCLLNALRWEINRVASHRWRIHARPMRCDLVAALASISLAFALSSPWARAADASRPAPVVTELPSPAGTGAQTPQLAAAPDDTLYLSWIEPQGEGHRLQSARFDSATRTWSAARTVAQGSDWFVNWADTPQIAAGPEGRLVAAWFIRNPAVHSGGHDHGGTSYGAWISFSEDHGATWSSPEPLSRESNQTEFVSLQFLPTGHWLAAWLDGRGRAAGGPMQLRSRVLGTDGPDLLVDDRVCDCCSTSLVAFPDGTALVAYRDRSDTEVRDIARARFNGTAWEAPAIVGADGWQINACPVNGPVLDLQGATVALTWYTAANDQPRVRVSTSADAGRRFLVPTELNETTRPLGRVDTVLLRDGSIWSSWLEMDGTVRLRRTSPAGSAGISVALTAGAGEAARAGGFPRLARIKDDDGSPGELLVVRTMTGDPSRLAVQHVTLPSADELAADDCGCDPKTQVTSYPVRGRIITPFPERGTLLVRHTEVPGVMRAMTMEFKVSPEALASAREGREILARIERRPDGTWWMSDIRMLLRPGESP